MPANTPIKSFEKRIAFNQAYRLRWKRFLDTRSRNELDELSHNLCDGMDRQSRDIYHHHMELIPHCFPHPILKLLNLSEEAESALLPATVRVALQKAGYFDDHISKLVEMQRNLQLTEPPLPELILHCGLKFITKAAQKTLNRSVVIDAGAYNGDTARLFQVYYKPTRVLALEPNANNFTRLSAAVKSWGAQETIIPINLATGKRTGKMELWGEGVGSSVVQKAELKHCDGAIVNCISIDDLCTQHVAANERVSCIKIDVEGAELQSIQGSKKTIEKNKPILLISVYHTPEDLFFIKPFLTSIVPEYKFFLRKVSSDLIKEIVLIAYVD